MRRHLLLPAILTLALGSRAGWAFNATGHEVIALIAWQELTPETRDKISRILRAHPSYADLLVKAGTPAELRDREAFLIAATWPDLVRTPGGKYAKYNHPAWHFVDFPYDPAGRMDFKPVDVTWRPGDDPANAAQAWQKCMAELKDAKLPEVERAVALAWIEHLAGDIHQPLHTISMFNDRFASGDQGGNLVMVMAGQSVTNLHALWDGLLGNYESVDTAELIAKRVREAHPRKEFAEQLKVGDFVEWAKAGSEQARKLAYLDGKLEYLTRDEQARDRRRAVPALPEGYLVRAKAAIESDAALAGYRLADVLNGLFSPPANTPATMPGKSPAATAAGG